nr:immunoglobulin heavy chain junction region [Macaca mulatta]MOW86570.1 immunoglobulin heavy chain junction region [Macaca mulatta]MOW86734.1 immunoglobulin heavy chain junction region [Macaca mulatta]MOW87225.1 immunoglobulin heavy chain junction region [Macaca mulatta]MOW87436.1 immunoglobulin heavy chain junction region [Macaca mulatta]
CARQFCDCSGGVCHVEDWRYLLVCDSFDFW